MDALSPDGLVREIPLENICGCSLTGWVGLSDFTKEFCDALSSDKVTPLVNYLCGCSVTRWVGENDSSREFCGCSHQMGL